MTGLSLRQLLDISKEALLSVAPEQPRYKVTVVPDERTLRHYLSQGLVDKPLARKGSAGVFGYRHLLQILVVKYLQAQYLPLAKIRSLMSDATNRDLEVLLPDSPAPPGRALVRPGPPAVEPWSAPPGARAAPAAEVPESAAQAGPGDRWHRIEVSPGVELHVHETALALEHRERLRGALLREMGRLRGWTA